MNQYLPIYLKIPLTKYTLAFWNCGDGARKRTILDDLKDLRITIREDGEWRFTIKKGDYEDIKRCSIDFKPFNINLSKFINK